MQPLVGLFEPVDFPYGEADRAFDILRAEGYLANHLQAWRERPGTLSPNVRANLELAGAFTLADRAWAAAEQTRLQRALAALQARHDLIIGPVTPMSPFPWTQWHAETVQGRATRNYYEWLQLTYVITLTTHPALSLPCGRDERGLPFGLQLVGRLHGDGALLAAARALEAALAADPLTARPLPDLSVLAQPRPELKSDVTHPSPPDLCSTTADRQPRRGRAAPDPRSARPRHRHGRGVRPRRRRRTAHRTGRDRPCAGRQRPRGLPRRRGADRARPPARLRRAAPRVRLSAGGGAAAVVFIGPTPPQLALFGDKARARALAAELGIPLLPGTGAGELPAFEAFLDQQRRNDPDAGIVLKAVAGGGGRGMCIVTDAARLPDAVQRCRAEAEAAFGLGELYAERLMPRARHVEVQVLGDGRHVVVPGVGKSTTIDQFGMNLIADGHLVAVLRSTRPRNVRVARSSATRRA